MTALAGNLDAMLTVRNCYLELLRGLLDGTIVRPVITNRNGLKDAVCRHTHAVFAGKDKWSLEKFTWFYKQLAQRDEEFAALLNSLTRDRQLVEKGIQGMIS